MAVLEYSQVYIVSLIPLYESEFQEISCEDLHYSRSPPKSKESQFIEEIKNPKTSMLAPALIF